MTFPNVVTDSLTTRAALQLFNEVGGTDLPLVLFLVNQEGQMIGALTDGDIRRGLLKGYSVEDDIHRFVHTRFRYLEQGNISTQLLRDFRAIKIYLVPVLNQNRQIVDILDLSNLKGFVPAEAVIMAGGRGERLRPLTDQTPKPLVKVGKKPILEHGIDHLAKFWIKDITLSVRYLADQIQDYFGDGSERGMNFRYLTETQPLGTIGALAQLRPQQDTILLMNSDLLTNINLADFYDAFQKSDADMAVATVPYLVNVPYGVLETLEQEVVSLKEKPTYTYHSNAGIYLLKKELIQLIPRDTFYNATDLMTRLMAEKRKLIHFPIIDYWLDIGNQTDYQKAQEDIKHLVF